MMQKYSHTKIYTLLLSIALLAACSSSDALTGGSTTDHPNGAIELSAGIVEGGSALVTRAGAEDNHTTPGHLTLTGGTQLALQVSGTWTGHTPSSVVQTTTATVGNETSTDSKHNNLSCSPVLYWDDYGTADPGNAATGRAEGLTIYGVAIDGYKSGNDFVLPSSLTSITNWEALSWTLNADQTSGENIPAKNDLLISNNVKAGTDDGTYKFTERESGKLLEFRHALSKITVNLKAGTDFPDDPNSDDPEVHKFEGTPEVKLTSNEANASTNTEWACLTGTVNITTGGVTSQGGNAAVTTFNSATTTAGWTKTYEALVMPGSEFTSDNAIIARINADGNIYYVTAEKIRAAITDDGLKTGEKFLTLSGKNYVINVIVNKTDIDVTATVTDWVTVNAAVDYPKINVTVGYGTPGSTVRVNTFSFYRSENLNANSIYDGYSTRESENLLINGFYKRSAELNKDGTMTPVRYWSNHNQHYHFRLVWPNTTTATKDATTNPDWPGETAVQKWRPHVERKTYDGTNYYQVIEIWNDKWHAVDPNQANINENYHPYPSNLAIARPEIFDNPATTDVNEQLCTNNEPGHTQTNLYTGGICATEGTIDLTFKFIMSQVEVNLTTTTTSSQVELKDAVVELVNVYNTGEVKLGDREVIQTGEKGNYTIDPVAVVEDNPETADVNEKIVSKNKRRSAIVPQSLDGVKFKITITNGDDTKDVYYADVEPILNEGKTAKVAPNGKWESGVHYVYHLNVSKTQIKATATLANWQTVEASEEVWF